MAKRAVVEAQPKKFVRKNRHWRDKFDKTKEFVWARRVKVDGEFVEPGKPVDKIMINAITLRRMWWNGFIQVAD